MKIATDVISVGLSMLTVGALCHILLPRLVPGLAEDYANESIFRPWGGITRAYMIAHPILFSVAFVMVHRWQAMNTEGITGWSGGMIYGAGVFLVGSLPVFVIAYASMRIPGAVFLAWIGQNAVQYVVAGALLGRLTR